MIHYSDTAIMEGIRSRDHEILHYSYEQFYPMIRFFIIRNNGSETDAEDLFQETIIAIFERLNKDELKLNCSFRTYVYSVCRYKWLQYLERKPQYKEVYDIENHVLLETAENYEEDLHLKKKLYQKHFLRLSENCRKVILLFLEKYPFDEVARLMGYKNRQYAIKRKYECVKSLYNRIVNDPEYKSLQE